MRSFTILASAGLAAASALPQWSGSSWSDSSSGQGSSGQSSSGSGQDYYGKAVYVMSNDVSGNAVIAMSIGSDGALSGGSSWPTGGIGGNYINSKTGKLEFPLALSSQDALIRVGDYLFAVNAGSDTVSMLEISKSDPTQLTMVGSPMSTNGDFPTTVAASAALKMVCVANTGARSGVSCSSYSPSGIAGFDSMRSMSVGQSTTPPIGPVPGYGDLFFSEDSTQLIALIKGNPGKFVGGVSTFPVSNGQVGYDPTTVAPPGSAIPVGGSTIPNNKDLILVSDAAIGGYTINSYDLSAEPIAFFNVSGLLASCWAEVTPSGRGFLLGPAANHVIEVNVFKSGIVKTFIPNTIFPGMSDFKIMGNYIWALAASNGSYATSIVTFDIAGGPGSISLGSVYAVPGGGVNTNGLTVY